jgi:GT2 family glycosyltransferase
MKLTIVIINYKVPEILHLCLLSVKNAIQDIETQVFVVDNASKDHSIEYLKKRHNWITIIENSENIGFSRANNQVIRHSLSEYVLILNPDTILEEQTLVKCLDFMEKNPQAGAAGVKMIGSNGKFQVESKRSFPTLWVSFSKISGLSKLLPKSKLFGRYNLSYLPENEINEIEILSGAFMFIRREALQKVGLFDEKYFMYGEDIDLSYRIIQAGYKNYYLPTTKILHFKGESTKKNDKKYIYNFNNAMLIFARKYFKQKNKLFFVFIQILVKIKIYLSYKMLEFNKLDSRKSKVTTKNILIIVPKHENEKIKNLIQKQKKNTKIFYILSENNILFSEFERIKAKILHNKVNEIVISFSYSKQEVLDIIHLISEHKIQIHFFLESEKKIIFTKSEKK